MKLFRKALPILLLIVLAALTVTGDMFKTAANVSWWQAIKTYVIALEPFARHVLIAGIVAYLAYWRFPHSRLRVQQWSAKFVSHARVTPMVTEVTQSAFPLLYWAATAVIVAYALDSSLFLYSGAVLVGIGYLFKSELNHLVAGIIIQLTAKVKVGDEITIEAGTGTLLEIGPLYSRLQLPDGELRINNFDLWDQNIKKPIPGALPAASAASSATGTETDKKTA